MRINSFESFLIISLVIIMSTSLYSQEYGKIFSKSEADKLYGPVKVSKVVENDVLKSALQLTKKVIMFRFTNNNLTILGDRRTLLYSDRDFIDMGEEFRTFSKIKLEELLSKGKAKNSSIEQRAKDFTISNGNYTLEVSLPCPPYCD